ncbi:MAG: ATP-binding cassette domain-containing protein, partial [Candidatus Methylomirabilis sp.]|nr:ATP-binding cassette domain-containing protein [Deltaproteobacteria bacterium]
MVARGITRVFRAGEKTVEVLRGVDLEVAKGESLAILGPSGAGKSTLLHILGGLDAPTAGTVRYGGTDIFALGDNDRAAFRNREIGFVFQFHHLLQEFTALENVMMPGLIRGDAPDKIRHRAAEL